jgi:hypothetical protein
MMNGLETTSFKEQLEDLGKKQEDMGCGDNYSEAFTGLSCRRVGLLCVIQ